MAPSLLFSRPRKAQEVLNGFKVSDSSIQYEILSQLGHRSKGNDTLEKIFTTIRSSPSELDGKYSSWRVREIVKQQEKSQWKVRGGMWLFGVCT